MVILVYMEKYIDELVRMKHFFETEIQCTQDKLDRSKEHLNNINNILLDCCPHQWTHDYIDVDVERSKRITICTLCESTKRISLLN